MSFTVGFVIVVILFIIFEIVFFFTFLRSSRYRKTISKKYKKDKRMYEG